MKSLNLLKYVGPCFGVKKRLQLPTQQVTIMFIHLHFLKTEIAEVSHDYCIYNNTAVTPTAFRLESGHRSECEYTELCFLPMISPDKKEYGNFHRQGDGIHTNQRTTFIRLTVNIVAEFLKGLYAKTTYTNFLLY